MHIQRERTRTHTYIHTLYILYSWIGAKSAEFSLLSHGLNSDDDDNDDDDDDELK